MTLKHLSYGLVIALSLSATQCVAMKKMNQPQEDISAIKRKLEKVKEEQAQEREYNRSLCITFDILYPKNDYNRPGFSRNRALPELDISEDKLALFLREKTVLEARLKEMGADLQDSTDEGGVEKKS